MSRFGQRVVRRRVLRRCGRRWVLSYGLISVSGRKRCKDQAPPRKRHGCEERPRNTRCSTGESVEAGGETFLQLRKLSQFRIHWRAMSAQEGCGLAEAPSDDAGILQEVLGVVGAVFVDGEVAWGVRRARRTVQQVFVVRFMSEPPGEGQRMGYVEGQCVDAERVRWSGWRSLTLDARLRSRAPPKTKTTSP